MSDMTTAGHPPALDVPALEVRGVRKTFEAENAPVRALRGTDFTMRANDFVAIMGPSGCGKSTLLNVVAGLDQADEGTVVVPGRLLLDIARSLPDADVTIEHKPEEAVVVVTAGSANYRLHTYSSEDFPRLPEVDTDALYAIERDALVETIARVGRSASRVGGSKTPG